MLLSMWTKRALLHDFKQTLFFAKIRVPSIERSGLGLCHHWLIVGTAIIFHFCSIRKRAATHRLLTKTEFFLSKFKCNKYDSEVKLKESPNLHLILWCIFSQKTWSFFQEHQICTKILFSSRYLQHCPPAFRKILCNLLGVRYQRCLNLWKFSLNGYVSWQNFNIPWVAHHSSHEISLWISFCQQTIESGQICG